MGNPDAISVPCEAEEPNGEEAEFTQTCEKCGAAIDEDVRCRVCSCCDQCCECWTCGACSNTFAAESQTGSCDVCQYCYMCCECTVCDSCGDRLSINSSWCGDCDRCTDCCRCSESTASVEFFTSRLTFHKAARNQFTRNRSRRFISCEIEVDYSDMGHNITDAVYKWKGSIVEDGSLPESGFEINTAPAQGDKFIEQIEEVCYALAMDGAQVSGACGLHVHVDARDFTYYDIRRLVILYAKIETALFGMFPLSRRHNNFCVPCAEMYLMAIMENRFPKTLKKGLIKSIYGEGSDRPNRQSKWSGARYNALNIHSWFYRGTIECRLHTGTTNAKKIIGWGKLWASILDSAMHLTESQIESLKGSGLEILYSLAPDEECRDYITARTIKFNN